MKTKRASKKQTPRRRSAKKTRPSPLLSHRAFAALADCSEGRVTQVIREGLVIENRQGKIDPALRANKEWAETHRARNGKGTAARGRKLDPFEVESRSEVELRKALAATEKLELQNAESRRELIRTEDDRRAWAKFYSVFTAELIPLFAKLAPEIAAALGVTDDAGILKVQELGDAAVFNLLEHAKSVMHGWLEEVGGEEKSVDAD